MRYDMSDRHGVVHCGCVQRGTVLYYAALYFAVLYLMGRALCAALSRTSVNQVCKSVACRNPVQHTVRRALPKRGTAQLGAACAATRIGTGSMGTYLDGYLALQRTIHFRPAWKPVSQHCWQETDSWVPVGRGTWLAGAQQGALLLLLLLLPLLLLLLLLLLLTLLLHLIHNTQQ